MSRPWNLIEASATDDGGRLELFSRTPEWSICIRGKELMNSRAHASEDGMARLAVARLGAVSERHVLVGGLGMGFTLRAALGVLGPTDRVTVAELLPAIVAWNRGPLADLAGRPLEDPRTTLRVEDVGHVMRDGVGAFDAILLDVDNGPDGLVVPSNDLLYGPAGLATARRALRPGGVLAVWSAHPSDPFTRRLNKAGFRAEVRTMRGAPGNKGPTHTVWFAT